MEPIAIGFCRLTPDEFWAMTPQEFWWRYEAEIEREKREFQRMAQLACWVMNPWLKTQYTVDKLLPSSNRRVEQKFDWAAFFTET